MNQIVLVFCLLAFFGCKARDDGSSLESKSDSRSAQSKFLYDFEIDSAIGEEYRPANDRKLERAEMQKLIELFSQHFDNNYKTAKMRDKHSDQSISGKALRAVHAKGHGCLIGTFEVLDHKTDDFKYGVFSNPRTFETVFRFSNGDGPPTADQDKTVSIGLAMKLREVHEPKLLGNLQRETTADFLMTNHPNFIVADVTGFVQVIQGRESTLQKPGAVIAGGKGLIQRRFVAKDNPLTTSYWSNLPFKIGPNSSKTAVKYLIRPTKCPNVAEIPDIKLGTSKLTDSDFLSKALENHIKSNDACFDFYLQRQRDSKLSPIEDATVSWPEESSDITRVGFIKIEKQFPNTKLEKVNQSTGKSVCQDLSFSPWNTTVDFQPLSSLNRARRVIYDLSAETRRELNGAINPEEK
jgi:hypothetical protein